MFRCFIAAVAFTMLCGAPALAQAPSLDGAAIRLTINTNQFGPADVVLHFQQRGSALTGQSSSAASAEIKRMSIAPAARRWRGDALFAVRAQRQPDGSYAGVAIGPDFSSPIRITRTETGVSGSIERGTLSGAFTGVPYNNAAPLRNYPAVITAIDQSLPQAVFNPHRLELPQYRSFHDHLTTVAAHAHDDLDLLYAVRLGWNNAVFSHFELTRQSRDQIVAGVDADTHLAAELSFNGDIAVLRVNTFLGEHAIEQINTAIIGAVAHNAHALIIDLRATPGGSLAAKTLIQGLISSPMPMGVFTAGAWWRTHDAAPTAAEIARRPVSTFDDPQAAFQTLMTDGVVPVEVRPAVTHFDGPVFVLIDHETVSVAELAAAFLSGSHRATLIGERTAGELLTADTLPLTEGFQMLLPLADYSDARLGRIEAVGVAPNVQSSSRDAMNQALALARR